MSEQDALKRPLFWAFPLKRAEGPEKQTNSSRIFIPSFIADETLLNLVERIVRDRLAPLPSVIAPLQKQ